MSLFLHYVKFLKRDLESANLFWHLRNIHTKFSARIIYSNQAPFRNLYFLRVCSGGDLNKS